MLLQYLAFWPNSSTRWQIPQADATLEKVCLLPGRLSILLSELYSHLLGWAKMLGTNLLSLEPSKMDLITSLSSLLCWARDSYYFRSLVTWQGCLSKRVRNAFPISTQSCFCVASQPCSWLFLPLYPRAPSGGANQESPPYSTQHTFLQVPHKHTARNIQEDTCSAVNAQSKVSTKSFKLTFYWKVYFSPLPLIPLSHAS